jgi:glycyl-tRNA synthetase alpha subunit
MALTKNDLQQLKEVVSIEITNQLSTQLAAQDVRFSAELRQLNVALHQQKSELKSAFDQQTQDIKRDIRDEIDARFLASETKMEHLFRHELQAVIDILPPFVPERFEKHEHDAAHIKTHIGLAT